MAGLLSHPGATIALVGMTSLDFGTSARSLARAARLRGLVVPVFASPPPRPDLDRSIRRRNGSPVVSVRLRGRPRGAVLADMIEGIVVANYLDGARADLVRSALWLAIDADTDTDAGQLTLQSETMESVPATRPQPNAAAAA